MDTYIILHTMYDHTIRSRCIARTFTSGPSLKPLPMVRWHGKWSTPALGLLRRRCSPAAPPPRCSPAVIQPPNGGTHCIRPLSPPRGVRCRPCRLVLVHAGPRLTLHTTQDCCTDYKAPPTVFQPLAGGGTACIQPKADARRASSRCFVQLVVLPRCGFARLVCFYQIDRVGATAGPA